MNRIKILPDETAKKIAAGEVIESPLSVIKELVENSIDAGSRMITVEIKKGGKDYIRVSDDGSGIEKDDLPLAILNHATSKISGADDLSNLFTLGFRGEALSSVAAVSDLEIISKTADSDSAYGIKVQSGKITGPVVSPGTNGTCVIVKNLFFNMPARLKFLKPDNSCSMEISDFISKIAVAYPHIKFRFINNGNIIFSTRGNGDIYSALLTVFNPQGSRNLIELSFARDSLTVKGYISSPLETQKNRKNQIFFVNGRLIKSSVLDNAVAYAYRDKLFAGTYPSVYMFLTVDPGSVDANIHPRKAEIKFSDEEQILNFVADAIRSSLLNKKAAEINSDKISCKDSAVKPINNDEPISSIYEHEKMELFFKDLRAEESIKKDPSVSDNFDTYKPDDSAREVFSDSANPFITADGNSTAKAEFSGSLISEEVTGRLVFSNLNIIACVFDTYILASDSESLYIIDQHAAHERVLYEKFSSAFKNSDYNSKQLLKPVLLELSKSALIDSDKDLDYLSKIGFSCEVFGTSTLMIREIPIFLDDTGAERFLYEFFESEETYKGKIEIFRDEIVMRSCKAAVKAHDKLSIMEISALFNDLDKCENPCSCPHGRPTYIKLDESELEKLFKRK